MFILELCVEKAAYVGKFDFENTKQESKVLNSSGFTSIKDRLKVSKLVLSRV